jgi:hypothetical protein
MPASAHGSMQEGLVMIRLVLQVMANLALSYLQDKASVECPRQQASRQP